MVTWAEAEASEGSTELRKATGFWMGLGVELLEHGDEAWGGDWARRRGEWRKAGGTRVGEDTKLGGLLAGSSTRVGKMRGGGDAGKLQTEEAGLRGELVSRANLRWSSAASSCSSGTGDSVGEGLRTGGRNSLGRA